MLFFTIPIPEQLVHFLWVHMAMDVVADDYVRSQGAVPNAGYSLQRIFLIRSSLTLVYIQVLSIQFQYRLPSPNMTSCSPADSNDFFAARLSVELGVEANHPLHLTGEEPQISGYERYRLGRDISELTLDLLEQRYHRPPLLAVFGNDGSYSC